MSGTRLNERISSNAQQKSISFEAAESSIALVWDVGELMGVLTSIPTAQFNDPTPVVPAAASQLANVFNQQKVGGGGNTVSLTAGVTVQYCGETLLPSGSGTSADESTVQMAGVLFDVNGTASIAGSNANSDHIQRGYVVRPKTGRTGSCVTPS